MAPSARSSTRRRAVGAGISAAFVVAVVALPVAAATPTRFPSSNAQVTMPTALPPLANPENAYADDGVYATGNLDRRVIGGVAVRGEFAHEFGSFGFDAIPVNATVTSVTAQMEYRFTEGSGTSPDYDLIVLSGGSLLASANGSSEPVSDTLLATGPFAATRDQLLDGAFTVEVAAIGGSGAVTQSMLVDYVSVTVAYTVPEPTITVPADIVRTTTSAAGMAVTFEVTASDDQDGPLTPTCTPPSGSSFQIGTTTVTCEATDSDDNTATGTFSVTVRRPTDPAPSMPPTSTAEPAADEPEPEQWLLLAASLSLAAWVGIRVGVDRGRARG